MMAMPAAMAWRLWAVAAAVASSIAPCSGRNFVGQSVESQVISQVLSLSYCNNTIQGPYFLTDSRGYVCSIRTLDPVRGCCPEEGQQFSCSGCNLSSQCCSTFEYCVSCCLDPMRTSKDFALHSKPARHLTAENYRSVFEYCTGRCRHNSASVVHENAYASEEHHCFLSQLNLSGSSTNVDRGPSANEGDHGDYSMIIGRQGQSCDEACQERGLACKPSRLPLINKCSVLQKYFNCKGACISGKGADLPSEVVSAAPRHLHPGACLFNAKDTLLSCQGTHRHTRRLCPCG